MNWELGDIVRYTGEWLNSVGWYTGVPINGRIIGKSVHSGSTPTVYRIEWSDGNESSVIGANVEIDKRAMRQVLATLNHGTPNPDSSRIDRIRELVGI